MTFVTAQVQAANDFDVRYTVHNLSYNKNPAIGILKTERNYSAYDSGNNQVCIFCHTPHNASPAIPLWNKVYASSLAGGYQLYTSSSTLSTTAKKAQILPNSESMLCLSCHDGKTAINVLHNSRGKRDTASNGDYIVDMDGTKALKTLDMSGTVNDMNIGAVRGSDGIAVAGGGTNLTDDHPVGFSYDNAQLESPNDLQARSFAKAQGIRFFGPQHDRLECSSCHNPHVYYGSGRSGGSSIPVSGGGVPTAAQIARAPFLNISNDASAMCLACHKK